MFNQRNIEILRQKYMNTLVLCQILDEIRGIQYARFCRIPLIFRKFLETKKDK